MIEGKLKESNLSKEIFLAKKGDVLLWHANLLHGAEKQVDKTKTRKSVVFHYFKKGVVCYHEITQRPALIQEN
jgi:ectoine hydroxylase-related dioxygenase (phytanoyl-CoA dioxygenase family)